MNIKFILASLLTIIYLPAMASLLSGKILDTKGVPLSGVSVSLLYPSDSTLATFGITDKEGFFMIKDATEAQYILQIAAPGYYTEYEQINFATNEASKIIPPIALYNNIAEQNLKEVIISGERIPVSIKGDTVEYNAGSFRVKPNAPVEELLRQLPGVQVDEKGNIKSMGKEVKKILVDGKDFFGTDPKIATKNLPADAIDKVQTFGKHSDESAFSGIDDGTREQTINLKLKEDKRKGYFGEVKAGFGTGDHADGSAKIFQFRPKSQLAALGTLNNINQFGFSFDDYINFNGGMGNLMNGGGMDNIDDLPIDFGQTVTGKNTSGAAGLNYALELRPQNRFSINYIGNGLYKTQENKTFLTSYLPSGESYTTDETEVLGRDNLTNNITAKWNNQIDSANQLVLTVNGQVKNNNGNNQAYSVSANAMDTVNNLNEDNSETGSTRKLTATGSWVHKVQHSKWKIIQANATLNYANEATNYDWKNSTYFPAGNIDLMNHQFQQNETEKQQAAITVSTARELWKDIYLEPKLGYSVNKEMLLRRQGNVLPLQEAIDSLSPQIENTIYSVVPGFSVKNGSPRQQWNIGVQGKYIRMNPSLKSNNQLNSEFSYLLPSVYWRRELRSGESLELSYTTQTQTPQPRQLLPVLYYSSPLSGIRGDLDLKPEYQQNFQLGYMHHDQFSMSSIFADIGGSYTKNKIGTAITILPNLSRQAQWTNTPYAANLHFDGSYSRPVRKLGIDINIDINESLLLSESPVNNVANKNTSYSHKFGFSVNNRKKKDKWNAHLGATVQVSDSRYSLNKELNNVFTNYSGFAYLSYQPNRRWFFCIDAKIKYYTAQSFSDPISIPLISAEITRYILANQRVSITLRAFDLLDKNKAVIRQGLDNYLVQQNSDVIQRYAMLVFTYKLNKAGN